MRSFARPGSKRFIHNLARGVRVAVFLAACGGLAACGSPSGVGSAPTSTPTGHAQAPATATVVPTSPPLPHPLALTFLRMVNGDVGWAAGFNLVLRTVDGGTHWRDVTPAGCRSSATSDITSITILNSLTSWFVCQQGSATGNQQTFVLFHTGDGGQDWQTTTLHLVTGVSVNGLTFVDASHGWLADEQGSATGHHFLTLYGTTDGGASWHEVTQTDQPDSLESAGLGSGPVFLNATAGWFGSNLGSFSTTPNQFSLSVTQDGGTTWRQQALPPPNGQVVGPTPPPTCFTAQQCVISLEVNAVPSSGTTSSPQPYLLLYVSSDAGQTWTAEPLVSLRVGHVAFLDPLDGWAIVDPNPPGISACGAPAASTPLPSVLEGTTDGGQHWTALNSTIDWCQLAALDFASPQRGWALTGSAGGETTLLRTTDGGVSWAEVPWQSA